ncbi:MAG: EAL domain-containing protein [Burkholderiaceae bacterium]
MKQLVSQSRKLLRIKPDFPSLRTRLLLLGAGSLLPVIALLMFQGLRDYDLAKERLLLQAESFAYQIAMFSKETVPEPYDYLGHLATVPEVLQDGAGCAEFLTSALKAASYFDDIFVMSHDGEMVCSGTPPTATLYLSQGNSSYLQRAREGRTFAIGDFEIGNNRSKSTLVFALPVLNDAGEVSRILGVAVNLSRLGESFTRALASDTNFADVVTTAVDASGLVVASTQDYQNVGRSVPEWDRIGPKLAEADRYTSSESWRDGVVRTTTYLPVFSSGAAPLYLRVGVPLATPLAAIRRDTLFNFLLLSLIVLSAMPAAWWLGHWLVLKPVRILTQTAGLLGDGVMSARTGLADSGGEIGKLARRFDEMAAQLQIQHDTLRRISRVQALRGATNSAMIRAENEKSLLVDICRIVCQIGGYQLAWVAYAEPGVPGNVLEVQAHAGADEELLADFLFAGSDDSEMDVGPVITALRSGAVQVFHDLAVARNVAPWRLAVARRGFATAIGLPIRAGQEVIGALGIFSNDPNAFGSEEIQLLTEAVDDVAFGISALRAAIEAQRSHEFLGLVMDNMPSMVFVKDIEELRFVSLNPAGERLIGFREEEVVGKTNHDLFPTAQADFFADHDRKALSNSETLWVIDEPLTSKTGEVKILQTKKLILTDAEGQPKYVLGISEDITERKKTDERLTYLATHDGLTGLPNRHLLMDRLSHAWSRAARGHGVLAVLYIDLDGFKEINDTIGHFAGDELLKAVSALLRSMVRAVDTVARVGGDEFVLILEEVRRPSDVTALAEKIGGQFEQPFTVAGQEIFIGASIGISLYPGEAESFEELLRMADIAMYQAKSGGRNGHAYYSPSMQAGSKDRLATRNLLRHAIERNELVLHYQPKVSLQTGKLVGAEALLRWDSKELGLVSPANFIPLAEESGLIVPIGEWVLRTACAQARRWQQSGTTQFVMAVNLSARQLREAGLLERIQQILEETGLDAGRLELEVTESTFMDRETNAIQLLNQISDTGIGLAVDDFGTGYSSLAYLKRLPVNVLKIDQSFVKGLTSDENDAAIVTAIVAMAKSLHLCVTAEGVETVEQLAILKNLQCDQYQGFLFSEPLRADEFERLLLKPA